MTFEYNKFFALGEEDFKNNCVANARIPVTESERSSYLDGITSAMGDAELMCPGGGLDQLHKYHDSWIRLVEKEFSSSRDAELEESRSRLKKLEEAQARLFENPLWGTW